MATSSDTSDQNHVKSRRPAESAFKQQRLPAWQPILTAGTVLPTFFVIGIAFIPVGIGLLYFSDEVKEHVIDYTKCVKKDDTITCAEFIKQTNMSLDNTCICEMEFNLTEDFKSDVYLYYGLSNYYQNHRRYVKSRDDNQLLGRLGVPISDCEPFAYKTENNVRLPVAPCGAIANSLFNDTLTLYSQEQTKNVPVLRTGIAWNSDKEIKFRNPDTSAFNGSLQAAFANFTKPINWAKHVWELDPTNRENNGFQNEDLIVWMRTAALPTFRKLYRRIDHSKDGFRKGLNKGPYTLKIEYNYPVTDFSGTKSFIISTTSLLGGKNPFLGVAYVVVGTLCLLLGIILLIIHVRCSKRYYPTPTDSFFLDANTIPQSSQTSIGNPGTGNNMTQSVTGISNVSKFIFDSSNNDDVTRKSVEVKPGAEGKYKNKDNAELTKVIYDDHDAAASQSENIFVRHKKNQLSIIKSDEKHELGFSNKDEVRPNPADVKRVNIAASHIKFSNVSRSDVIDTNDVSGSGPEKNTSQISKLGKRLNPSLNTNESGVLIWDSSSFDVPGASEASKKDMLNTPEHKEVKSNTSIRKNNPAKEASGLKVAFKMSSTHTKPSPSSDGRRPSAMKSKTINDNNTKKEGQLDLDKSNTDTTEVNPKVRHVRLNSNASQENEDDNQDQAKETSSKKKNA